MLSFIITSVLLGIGLAMDAFSVSLANGLHEPHMKAPRMSWIAGVFAGYQFLMPLIGWVCVHTIVTWFSAFQNYIPWIAFGLLAYIGGKMVWEGFHEEEDGAGGNPVDFRNLMIQGIATSIDALSVGFTIASYSFGMALLACVLIGIVTFVICMAGLYLGKRFGMRFAGKATVFGGFLLIAIGLEILLSHFL